MSQPRWCNTVPHHTLVQSPFGRMRETVSLKRARARSGALPWVWSVPHFLWAVGSLEIVLQHLGFNL